MKPERVDRNAVPERSHKPPPRVLLCLGSCYGEFHLPLDENERIACPFDATHPVAIYRLAVTIAAGEEPS